MAILLFHLFQNIFGKDCSSMKSVRKWLSAWWSALFCGRGVCCLLFLPRFRVGSQQKRKSLMHAGLVILFVGLCVSPQQNRGTGTALEMKSLRSCRAAEGHRGPCASLEGWWRDPRMPKRQSSVQWTVSEPCVSKVQKMDVRSLSRL